MSAGLKVFNDNGLIQITENGIGFVIIDRGTITTNDKGIAYLTLSNNNPVFCAVSSSIDQVGSICVSKGRRNGAWVFAIVSSKPNMPIEWYAFSYPNQSNQSNNAGLRVWTETGQLAFDSNQKRMHSATSYAVIYPVAALKPGQTGGTPPANNYIELGLPRGRRYAGLIDKMFPYYYTYLNGPQGSGRLVTIEYNFTLIPYNTGTFLQSMGYSRYSTDPQINPLYPVGERYPINQGIQRYWVIDITDL